MDSWAVANGMSCKSVPDGTGMEEPGVGYLKEWHVDRPVGSMCTESVEFAQPVVQRGFSVTRFTVYHRCPLSPRCLHSELMDGMTLVAEIGDAQLPLEAWVLLHQDASIYIHWKIYNLPSAETDTESFRLHHPSRWHIKWVAGRCITLDFFPLLCSDLS